MKLCDKTLRRALKAAEKKLPFAATKKMEANLDMACGNDLCEAYRIGAEEAQWEIAGRIAALLPRESSDAGGAP